MPNEQERPRFLTDLLAEVDAFDAELFRPNEPVAPGEVIAGPVPAFAAKCYALSRYLKREMKVIAAEREYDGYQAVRADSELVAMTYKQNVITELQWFAIRSELQLWLSEGVGVRANWQVVTFEPEDTEEHFEKFLRSLMSRRKK